MASLYRFVSWVACAALAFLGSCTKPAPGFCDESRPCEGGLACDLSTNTCVDDADAATADPPDATPTACPDSTECTEPTLPICDDETDLCRGCTSQADCELLDPLTPICNPDGSCTPCADHEECASGVCDVESGACASEADVVYVSTNGSASDLCGTKELPCDTLTAAVGAVSGSRKFVKVSPGTYDDEPSQIGVMGKDVHFIAYGAELASTGGHGVVAHANSNVVVEGMTIRSVNFGVTVGQNGSIRLFRGISRDNNVGAAALDGTLIVEESLGCGSIVTKRTGVIPAS